MAITFNEAVGGPVPNTEIENRVQDSGGLPSSDKYHSSCFYGELLAAGTGTAGTVYGPLDLAEIKTLMGEHSPVHLMAEKYAAFNSQATGRPNGSMYVCGIVEVATGTAASKTLTFATNATGNGAWIFKVGGHQVRVNVRTDDTPTQQALAFIAAYNALPYAAKSPIGLSPDAGEVTLLANVKGEHPNSIGLSTLQDPDVGTTATWSGTSMGDGVTAGVGVQNAAAQATALASLAGEDGFAFTVIPWRDVDGATGSVDEVVEHVNSKGDATNMISSFAFWGDDQASATLVSNNATLNGQDCTRVLSAGLEGTETWNAELAVTAAAAVSSEPHMARSINGVKAASLDAPSQSDKFTPGDLRSLLEGGVTPFYVHKGESQVGVCRAIAAETTYGVFDFDRMRVADYVRDDINAQITANLSRASIVEDDAVVPNAEHVTSPAAVRALIHSRLKRHESNALITNVDSLFEKYVSELDASAGELRGAYPQQMVSQLHNLMIRQDILA